MICREEQEVLDSLPSLSIDETTREVMCPFCPADKAERGAFTVTRTSEGFIYNCYRASCIGHGFIPTTSTVGYDFIRTKKPKASNNTLQYYMKEYSEVCMQLEAPHKLYLQDKFDLSNQDINDMHILYNTTKNSYVYQVRDIVGRDAGIVDRAYWGRKPKAYTYWDKDTIHKLHFPSALYKGVADVMLVEDIVSAHKASRFRPTAAVLGASLSVKDALLLRNYTDSLTIALDPDANSTALNIQNKYRLLFTKVNVLYLPSDIKNIVYEDLQDIL